MKYRTHSPFPLPLYLFPLIILLLLPTRLHPQTLEEWLRQEIINSYIQGQIEDLLRWDSRFEITDLEVTVQNGMVTIAGGLSSETARETVTDVVMSVPGVREVEDLTVTGHRTDPRRMLEENIREALTTIPALNRLPIEVQIAGDTIVLTGRVDELWKKEKAAQLAAGVSGLQQVRNRLLVVPSNDIVDEWVARRIQRILEISSYRDIHDLTVSVDRGRAVMMGTVESLEAKRAAYMIVLTTGGVTEIENRIEILDGIARR